MKRCTPGRRHRPWSLIASICVLLLPLSALGQPRTEPLPGDFRIENGRVDRGTYLGWRVFHTACHGCHGTDALGTDIAPNLLERVVTMTPRAFATKVLTSYRLVPTPAESDADARNAALERLIEQVMRQERVAAGEIAMPAWDDNPRVAPHVLDLYAYLSARADGKLAPGKPVPMGRPQPRRAAVTGGHR